MAEKETERNAEECSPEQAADIDMKIKCSRRFKSGLSLGVVVVTAFLLGFEAYTFAVVHSESQTSLPENYGNFERIRNSLAEQRPKDEFSFAVVGDTQGTKTFERLCDELRNEPLSFMVILGDFVKTSTKGNHDYFRSRCAKEYRLPFPVFLVVGNRDVACEEVDYDIDGVSPADFGRMYGPRNFSFEYNGCLFIGLCILPAPFSTGQSIEFLNSTLAGHREGMRKVFVFTHAPVFKSVGPATGYFENVQAFIDIVDRYEVDYVLSAHYHGYARTKRKDTAYLVTGGGGGPLDGKGGFHHAIVLTVDRDSISERTVFARHSTGVTSTLKHFAMAKLAPLLRKHPALAIVVNLLTCGMFCVYLSNFIRSEMAMWWGVGDGGS